MCAIIYVELHTRIAIFHHRLEMCLGPREGTFRCHEVGTELHPVASEYDVLDVIAKGHERDQRQIMLSRPILIAQHTLWLEVLYKEFHTGRRARREYNVDAFDDLVGCLASLRVEVFARAFACKIASRSDLVESGNEGAVLDVRTTIRTRPLVTQHMEQAFVQLIISVLVHIHLDHFGRHVPCMSEVESSLALSLQERESNSINHSVGWRCNDDFSVREPCQD